MKKLYLKSQLTYFLVLAILAFFPKIIQAQTEYTLTTKVETYTDLSADSALNDGLVWMDYSYIVPLGFDFECVGGTSSTVDINTVYGPEVWLISNPSGNSLVLVPIEERLLDRAFDLINGPNDGDPGSMSKISIVTEGMSGDRVCKIQWQNAGYQEDIFDDDVSTDYINMQVWIYEKDGSFEYRYGPNMMTQPSLCYEGRPGPQSGYRLELDTGISYINLVGDPSSPVQYIYDDMVDTSLNSPISVGIVYRFEPTLPLSVRSTREQGQLAIFPNPTSDIVNISNVSLDEIESIEIFNSLGQSIATYSPRLEINLSDLSAGIYLIRLLSSDEELSTSILKE